MLAEIKITDLDELIDSEAKLVKVAGYTIDLNKIPLKVLIEVNKMLKNPSSCTEDIILKNIIHTLIKFQGHDISYNEDFENCFTVKKILKFWSELLKEMYGVDVENTEVSDTASSIGDGQTYKKKDV